MGKQSGLGDRLFVAGYDLSGDIGSITEFGGGPGLLPVTGIDKSAYERIGGLRDGRAGFMSYFNPSANMAHDRLGNLPTADVIVSWFRGSTLAGEAGSLVGKQVNYDGNRADNGAYTHQTQALANGFGCEFGKQLTAGKRTDGAPTNGTGVDFGTGSTTFGLQAWLHVFAFTGTNATVKLQESNDNAGTDPYADTTGGGFSLVTGITAERIQTARNQTVKRWLRVVTTGTFSNLVFAVMVARNDVSVVF